MPYRPLFTEAGRIHVCGHRGHSAGAPENTIPALEEAARRGANVCEIDVVLTGDGEAVLLHDERLDRTTDGTGWAGDLTMAEVGRLDAGSWFAPAFAGTRVPTLHEALGVSRGLGLALHVEIKERRRPDPLIERLAVILDGPVRDDVLVISFDHPSLRRAQARIPGLRTEIITHARHVDPAGLAQAAGADSVAIEWDMFHADDARALHRAGIAVRVTIPTPAKAHAWPAYARNAEGRIRAALREGLIDIVACDDVEEAVRMVADPEQSLVRAADSPRIPIPRRGSAPWPRT